jgi:hypothetical protein
MLSFTPYTLLMASIIKRTVFSRRIRVNCITSTSTIALSLASASTSIFIPTHFLCVRFKASGSNLLLHFYISPQYRAFGLFTFARTPPIPQAFCPFHPRSIMPKPSRTVKLHMWYCVSFSLSSFVTPTWPPSFLLTPKAAHLRARSVPHRHAAGVPQRRMPTLCLHVLPSRDGLRQGITLALANYLSMGGLS